MPFFLFYLKYSLLYILYNQISISFHFKSTGAPFHWMYDLQMRIVSKYGIILENLELPRISNSLVLETVETEVPKTINEE